MPHQCDICGKGVVYGHTVSHAHNVGPRQFNPNLQTVKVLVDGKKKKLSVCTQCIKAGRVQKAK